MKRVIVMAIGLVIPLIGISGSWAQSDDDLKVYCTGSDCDVKMRRAERWVAENSLYPISDRTDTSFTTMRRLPFGSPDLVYTITKEQIGYPYEQRFILGFKAGCGTFIAGCRPTIDEAERAFHDYVTGTALPGAIVQQGPGGITSNTAKLVCKGGGKMTVRVDYQTDNNDGLPSQVVLEIGFERAPMAADAQPPGPGQCALDNRALGLSEPAKLTVSGPIGKMGFAVNLSADQKVTAYDVRGSGELHDNISTFMKNAMTGGDFSAIVANINNEHWIVTED